MDDLFSTLLAILFACFLGISICSPYIEEQQELRKDIIENTEEYATYDYCERIDEKYYCFNEN